jgi:hypothetical protein
MFKISQVSISQGVFSRRTVENRPFPLKASIDYKTLSCANALACDSFSIGLLPNRIGLYIRLGILASGSLPVLQANNSIKCSIKA